MILEINFNFGTINNSGEQTSYFLSVIIPVLIAVFTVVFTIFLQRIYDNYKRNESLDALYKHIKRQILNLNEAGQKQADSLKDLSAIIKAKEIKEFSAEKVTSFSVDLVGDWNSIDFYYSIVSRKIVLKDGKNDLSLLLDYHIKLKAQLNRYKKSEYLIEKYFDEFNLKYNAAQTDFGDHAQSIGDLLDFYKIGNNGIGDEWLVKYDKIVADWHNAPLEEGKSRTEISNVYANSVVPLRALNKAFPNDVRVWQLERELLRCFGAYQEIGNLKNVYSKWFTNMSTTLVKIKTDIETEINDLDSLKPKCKFQFFGDKL